MGDWKDTYTILSSSESESESDDDDPTKKNVIEEREEYDADNRYV